MSHHEDFTAADAFLAKRRAAIAKAETEGMAAIEVDDGYWHGFEQDNAEQAPPKVVDMQGRTVEATDRLPLTYFADIMPSLEANDFVQGLLFSGTFGVFYGEPGSGKTFLATDLAMSVAAGLEWNGKRVDIGGVIYCVLEGITGFRNRVAAWKLEHDTLDGPVHFASIQSSVNMLTPGADVETLIGRVKEAAANLCIPVKLVVIDTLSRSLQGGDENSSVDMGALIANVHHVIAQTGAMVLMVHHSGKDAARGARGWSGLKGAIDTEVEITRSDEGRRAAKVVKQKEGEDGADFPFSLDIVTLGQNRHGEDVTTCVVKFSDGEANAGASLRRYRLPPSQQRALEVLADLVAGSGQSGHPGTPTGIPSVPEKWWRDRFYDRAMPGAEQKAKEKAFRRAADALMSSRFVGMSAARVWMISHEKAPE